MQSASLLIYGLGRSGRSVATFLASRGQKADWIDQRPTEQDEALMQELGFSRGDVALSYDVVIAAPGVPIDHPDLLQLKKNRAEIIGEVALAARFYPDVPLIGITGTAGKGSTTLLVGHLLRAAGVYAREGGNIDPPLLDIIDQVEVAVVELSSFQLERIAQTRFPVAVVTNLGVDHLDRHLTIDCYHEAKQNITSNQTEQDILLTPATVTWPTKAKQQYFNQPIDNEYFLEDDISISMTEQLPSHVYPANAAAALRVTWAVLKYLQRSVDPQILVDALVTVPPVAGRFEEIARWNNISFIEDSIATRTLAVTAALERAKPPIAWLVGGRDKGADLEALRAAANGVVRVIAFGEDGERLAKGLELPYEVATASTPDEIMQQAVRMAIAALDAEGTVLLAPVGTSFDLFRNYKERGDCFTKAVRQVLEVQ